MPDQRKSDRQHRLQFHRLPGQYSIVKLPAEAPVPDWSAKGNFSSVTRTGEELSIVCPSENVPPNAQSPHQWVCLKLEGPFPFSLTGVLLAIIEPLSTQDVPIFAVSTFDTDYVLIQEEHADKALELLAQAGHQQQP